MTMAQNTQNTPTNQPRNIFEVINQNLVDLSQDLMIMFAKVDSIYNALYPTQNTEPTDPGAVTSNEQ